MENNFYSTEMPNYKGYMKKMNHEKIVNSFAQRPLSCCLIQEELILA